MKKLLLIVFLLLGGIDLFAFKANEIGGVKIMYTFELKEWSKKNSECDILKLDIEKKTDNLTIHELNAEHAGIVYLVIKDKSKCDN